MFPIQADIKAVSPQEDFTCSLGVDPAVKVTYKPVNKFREQSGLLNKTSSTTYQQVIEIKNTHNDAIKILVSDQLPLSTEEKIKVWEQCHCLQAESVRAQVFDSMTGVWQNMP